MNSSTSGTSNVRVNNIGGGGVQTVEGIKLIDVAGARRTALSRCSAITCCKDQQAMVIGAYAYTLQKGRRPRPPMATGICAQTSSTRRAIPAHRRRRPRRRLSPLYQPGVPLV